MTDDIHSDADSNRNAADKQNAEIHDSPHDGAALGEGVYLVEYPDGSVEYEPNTVLNVALFEDDLYDELQGETEYTVSTFFSDTDEKTIRLDGDVESKRFLLERGDYTVEVPSSSHSDIVNAIRSSYPGNELNSIYEDLTRGMVRRDVVAAFSDRFPDDRVDTSAENGWVVDDTFLVTYEAENYLVDTDTTYVREGDKMVETDKTKEAVSLSFNTDERREMVNDSGNAIEVDGVEQQFLATVECLLFPEDYLDAELVSDIEQHKAESFTDDVTGIAETANVSGFTDTKTGNYHGHGFNKHRASEEVADGVVDNELGLTEEAADKLYFNDYDHAAPHELLARREEFENAPFDIFTDDVNNDESRRWLAIERAKGKAPISPEHQEQIQEMFEE